MMCQVRGLPRVVSVLGIALAGSCAMPEPTISVVARDAPDPMIEPLAVLTRESREPIGFKIVNGMLIALTGRIQIDGATPVERAQRFVAAHPGLYGRAGGAPQLAVR